MEHGELEIKPTTYLPFEVLPESRNWRVGQNYRVKLVLRQTGTSETGANFEVVDATSLEPADRERRRKLVSDTGTYFG